jgi:hypothetical protein
MKVGMSGSDVIDLPEAVVGGTNMLATNSYGDHGNSDDLTDYRTLKSPKMGASSFGLERIWSMDNG